MLVDEMILKLTADVTGLIEAQKKVEAVLNSMQSKSNATSKKNVQAANDVDAALQKQRRNEAKAEREREAAAKKQGEALIRLRNDIVAVTAAYVGFSALKNVSENLLKMNAQIGFSADTLGMSEDGLNSWIQVASTFNASAEEVTGAFGKINAIQSSLKTGVGTGASIAALTQYAQTVAGLTGGKVSVDMGRLTGRETTSEEFISELSVEIQKMSLKDATIALSNLGIGPNIARMLHDVDLGGKLSAAKKADDEAKLAIQNAKELAQQWARIRAQAKGVADVIENDVMPYLKKFADMVSNLLGYAKEHPKTTEAVIGTGAAAVAGVSSYLVGKRLKSAIFGAGAKKAAVEGGALAAETAASGSTLALVASRLLGVVALLMPRSLGSGTLPENLLAPKRASGRPELSEEDKRALRDDILRESGGNQIVAQRKYNDIVRNWHAGQNAIRNTTSSEVHIGQLTVTTQAKDAPGVAAAIDQKLQNWSLATHANNGIR